MPDNDLEMPIEWPEDAVETVEDVQPPASPLRILDQNGHVVDKVVKDQQIRIELELDRPVRRDAAGQLLDADRKIKVTIKTEGNEEIPVELTWDGGSGQLTYISEGFTLEWGGGGGQVSGLGFEFSTGGGLDTEPGEVLFISHGDLQATTARVFHAQTELAIWAYREYVAGAIGRYVNVILNAQGFLTFLEQNPDVGGADFLTQQTRAVLADAQARHWAAMTGMRLLNDDALFTAPQRAEIGETAVGVLQLRPGDANLMSHASVTDRYNGAIRRGREDTNRIYHVQLGQAAIGVYALTLGLTGAGFVYTLSTGETIMGREASTAEMWMAVIEAITFAAMMGIQIAWSQSMLVRNTSPRIVREGRLQPGMDPLKAPDGTIISPADAGMLGAATRDFNTGALVFDVIPQVRPTNKWSMYWNERGATPKGMDLKAKTINEADQLLGADASAPPGRVGFFEPQLPPEGAYDGATYGRLVARYQERSAEFGGPTGDKMRALIEKGKYEVRDGAVWDVEHKAWVAGDHDIMQVLDARTGLPVEAARYDSFIDWMMGRGDARVKHGAHARWDIKPDYYPTVEAYQTDMGIFNKIFGSHGQGGEALITFAGSHRPPFVMYSDSPGVPFRLAPMPARGLPAGHPVASPFPFPLPVAAPPSIYAPGYDPDQLQLDLDAWDNRHEQLMNQPFGSLSVEMGSDGEFMLRFEPTGSLIDSGENLIDVPDRSDAGVRIDDSTAAVYHGTQGNNRADDAGHSEESNESRLLVAPAGEVTPDISTDGSSLGIKTGGDGTTDMEGTVSGGSRRTSLKVGVGALALVAVVGLVLNSGDQGATGPTGSTGVVQESGDNGDQSSAGAVTPPADPAPGAGPVTETPALDLVEIGLMGLEGTGRPYTGGQAFDAFFHLLFVPNGAIAQINRLYDQEDYLATAGDEVATATGGQLVAEVEVTQYSADPETGGPGQNTYGVVVQIDPASFVIAAFGSDGSTFSEANAFELSCEGFPDCDGARLRGVNLGGPFGLDPGQTIRDAIRTLQEGPSEVLDGYGWALEIVGTVTGVTAAEPGFDSQIVGLRNGVWNGERFVRIDLSGPVDQSYEFLLEFGSNEDDRMITGFRPSDGHSTSLCIGATPACPDGIFPIAGDIADDNTAVIFIFEEGRFDNSTGVFICASIKTEQDESPLPASCEVQVDLSDGESNPQDPG